MGSCFCLQKNAKKGDLIEQNYDVKKWEISETQKLVVRNVWMTPKSLYQIPKIGLGPL